MKNPMPNISESLKTTIAPPPPAQKTAACWGKGNGGGESVQLAPPPAWTRYIDSRLKQFCTR